MLKLICESIEDTKVITESNAEGKKRFYLEGTYLMGNHKNRNGRIYDSDMLEQEVNRYRAEKIDRKCAWGELGHPEGPNINLDRVCVLHESVRRDGDVFIGRSRVVSEHPKGQIVEALIGAGGTLGVSSRGMGSVKVVEGIMRVQSDFRLATLSDVVADPSAHDAWVQGIFESANWLFDPVSQTWSEAAAMKITEEVKTMSAKDIQFKKAALFENFMNTLVNRKR